jgi:hypothetical protein
LDGVGEVARLRYRLGLLLLVPDFSKTPPEHLG